MRRVRAERWGVTLIEIIVALALIAVVSAVLFSLVSGTLRFTSQSRAVSVSLEGVADVEGYLNDVLRYARQVYGELAVEVEIDDELEPLVCSLSTGRCVAVVIPVVDDSVAASIIDFDLLLLVVTEIGDLYEADGLSRGWRGNHTLALLEYRIESMCDAGGLTIEACAASLAPDKLPSTTFENPPGVLLIGLDDQDGTIEFFSEVQPALLRLTLSARAGVGRTETPVVRQSSVALQVLVREVAAGLD